MPIDGSLSDQGWYYVTAQQASEAFALAHECGSGTQPVATPWDGGAIDFRCTEHVQCAHGRVMTCLYDAGPSRSTIRAPLFVARTLNATGQYRVTLSLR